MNTLDFIPLWAFFLLTLGITLLSAELGYRMGKRRHAANCAESLAALGPMVGSTLGLLAFLLAIVFNISAGRFDERRTAVLTEANAIGTAYLRADFLENPAKEHVKELFRQYVEMRTRRFTTDELQQVVSTSEAIHSSLWAEVSAAANKHPSTTMSLLISAVNDVIDIHSKRVALALYGRLPLTVWYALLTVAALAMIGVGYNSGLTGVRSWNMTAISILTFSIVVLLAADLERPREGLLKVSQQPMIDLSKQIGSPKTIVR